MLCSFGITVLDDTKPLEENIPYVGAPVNEGGVYDGQVWVNDGIDPRKATNYHHYGPKIMSVSPSIFNTITLLDFFLILFTVDYVRGIMFPGIKRRLHEGDPHVSEHEFIK